jgi:predicted transcriptional regulator
MKRLSIDIPDEQHKKLKVLAAERGESVTSLIGPLIEQFIILNEVPVVQESETDQ